MAKTTKPNGPTYTPEELGDPDASGPIREAQIQGEPESESEEDGGEPQSVGTNSSRSSEKLNSTDDKPESADRKPARTMDNRSNRTARADSDVNSTGGAGRATGKGSRSKTKSESTEDDDIPEEFA